MLEAYALGRRDPEHAIGYVRARLNVERVSDKQLRAYWDEILAEAKSR
jgi:hypothetical protein